uniref:Uncharacterized protein n=1 Tax=Anguilla anguilla TaxID=7936 RepID=A0A0E9XTY0_ANGAN
MRFLHHFPLCSNSLPQVGQARTEGQSFTSSTPPNEIYGMSVRDQGPCQYSHCCHIDQRGVHSLSTPLSTASKTRMFFPSCWCKP